MEMFVLNGKTYPVKIPSSPTVCWQVHDHIVEQVQIGKLPLTVPAVIFGLYMLSPKLREELKSQLPGLRIAPDTHLDASIRIADAVQLGSAGNLAELVDLTGPICAAFRTMIPAYAVAEVVAKNSEPTP